MDRQQVQAALGLAAASVEYTRQLSVADARAARGLTGDLEAARYRLSPEESERIFREEEHTGHRHDRDAADSGRLLTGDDPEPPGP